LRFASFVSPPERIAVFDNDRTLWSEQPFYVQLAFVFERVKALAPAHPEWKTKEPFAAALAGGEPGLVAMMAATHSGMTTEEFARTVTDWIGTAKHPKTGRRYTEMVYQPMLELLAVKWHNYKVHFYRQETMVSPAEKLPVPLLFNLYTNPQEDEEKPATDTWVIGPVLKMVGAFQESVKKYPLIAMGTPDPYQPPRPQG
jgi:hypothetical protein